jgi:hypothetical protein
MEAMNWLVRIAGPEGAEGTGLVKAGSSGPESVEGTGLVDRHGIGPANNEGIGFWPPRPEEIEAVRKAAVAAGLVWGKKRGRKPKVGEGPAEAPAPGLERASGRKPDGDTPFI